MLTNKKKLAERLKTELLQLKEAKYELKGKMSKTQAKHKDYQNAS